MSGRPSLRRSSSPRVGATRAASEHGGQRRVVGGGDVMAERLAQQPFLRHVQHRREIFVAVEHLAVDRQRQRALLDLLDEHAVGPVGTFQRVDLPRAAGDLHDHGIEIAAPDRLQRILALLELGLEIADPGAEIAHDRLLGHVGTRRYRYEERSSPRSTRASFERSPTIRRTGSGASFRRVGAATTWFSSAR